MDFRGMKRKEMQALCKQHGIPANLTNLEMADKLSLIYKENEKPLVQGRSCLRNLDEIDCLNDSNGVTCEPKRVRFSPDNETLEFEDSEMDIKKTPARTRATRAARRSLVRFSRKKVSPISENAENSESHEENKDTPKRITRHQAQKVVEGDAVKASPPLVREKKAKKGAKIKSTVSETEFEDSEIDMDNVPARTRAARAGKRSMVRLAEEKVSPVGQNAENGESFEDNKDTPKRNTRNRAQKVVERDAVKASPPRVRENKAKKGTEIKSTVSETEFEESEMDMEIAPARTRAARAGKRSRVRLAEEKVSPVSEKAENSESCEEDKDTPRRITRYQAQKVVEGDAVKASPPLVRESKAKKDTKIKSTVSETEFEDPKMDMEIAPARTRAARAGKRSRVRLAEEKVSPVSEKAENSESCEVDKDTPKRITRYHAQKVVEGDVVKTSPPLVEEKKAKKGTKIKSTGSEIVDKSAELAPMLEVDDNTCGKENGRKLRRHLRSGEVVVESASELGNEDFIVPRKSSMQTRSKKMNQKDSNEVLTSNEISKDTTTAGGGEICETEEVIKQSKRKASRDGKRESLDGELEKRKVVGRITRSHAQLVTQEASAVESDKETGDGKCEQLDEELEKSTVVGRITRSCTQLVAQDASAVASEKETGSKLQVSEDSGVALQLEEPSKFSGRNNLRRKSVVSQTDPSVRNETRKPGKDTRLKGEASKTEAGSKEKGKAPLTYGSLRRSRRNTSVFKSTISPDGELATHEAVGRNRQLKHLEELITEKAASKPETSTEILKENDKVSKHNAPLRRSRSTSTSKSSAPAADGNLVADDIVGRNEHSKYLRESTSDKETAATEAHLRRSKRNASRHDSITESTDSIPNVSDKNEAQKRKLQLIPEVENSVIEREPLIDGLPRKSKGKVPLTESVLDPEETPSMEVEMSKPEAAGSKSPAFIHQEGTPEDTNKKRKRSRKISTAKKKQHQSVEVCPVISDLEEVEACATVNFEDVPSQSVAAIEDEVVEDPTPGNLEDIPSQSAVAVEEDISMENVEDLVQDNVNEGNKVDEESQFQKMGRDLDYDNSFEPQGDQSSTKVRNELVSPVSGSSSVHQPEYSGPSADNVRLRRELEMEEELSAGKNIDSTNNILADLATDNDKLSVERKQKLGLEEISGCAKPIMHELENLTESHESGSSKRNSQTFSEESSGIGLLNPSNGEQTTPYVSGRRDIGDVKDPEAGAEFPENVVASHVGTAEIVAEKVAETQLASIGQWSPEETPLKILIAPELTSAVMDDKVVGSCLHTVSADNDSQEEGYQLDVQLDARSPVLGSSYANQAEEEKPYYKTGVMDGTMSRGNPSVSDASERKEHPVLDELDDQVYVKNKSVGPKGITSFSEEVKETDVSYLDFPFKSGSFIIEKSTPSCEHAHMKDKDEEDQDSMEKDEEPTHVTEMTCTAISADKTTSTDLGSVKLLHEKSQEDAGEEKRDHEGLSNMSNPSLDVDEHIYNEASKGNLDVEFTGVDASACPYPNKFSKDVHAAVDTLSGGGSHVYSESVSQEGRGTNVNESSVEEITPTILKERNVMDTRDSAEGDTALQSNAESQLTPGSTAGDMEKEIHFAEITPCSDGGGLHPPLSHANALEHQASGNGCEEMSLSTSSPHIPKQEENQLGTVSINDSGELKSFIQEALPMSSPPWFLEKLYGPEEEDSEMNCNAHSAADKPFSKQSVVTLDGKGIEDQACVGHSSSVATKESGEVSPDIEIGSVHNHHHVVVEQVNYNVEASLAKSNCKDNKRSDEDSAGYSSIVHVNLVTEEKRSEFLPGTELGDSQEVNAQENINFDASLDEITTKESEALEKTTSRTKKSILEGIEEFNMPEGESGEFSAPVNQTEPNTEVSDQGVKLIQMSASAQVALVETVNEDAEVPKGILNEVTSKETNLLSMEADFDCNQTKGVAMEVKNEISVQHDELKSIDPDIHDLEDKSIFISSDQCISADRETTDEIEHSTIVESKFNFGDDCSDSKRTDVSASPISLKDFCDRVEDDEVAQMHGSDHSLSLDLLHHNSIIAAKEMDKTIGEPVNPKPEDGEAFTPVDSEGLGQEVSDHGVEFPNPATSEVTQAVHEADENLDLNSDEGEKMIWQDYEVNLGEDDDHREEEVLTEADTSCLLVQHETSTDGADGTMKENNHIEDVNFDSMKPEDVSHSPKTTAGDYDDLLEEKSADVKHNVDHFLSDLNRGDTGGALEVVVEERIGSDDRNAYVMWAQVAQTSPCRIDDSNISSSEAARDSNSASVSQLNVSGQGGECGSYVHCTQDSTNSENKESNESVRKNDTNEATICSIASIDFCEDDKGNTLTLLDESSEGRYMTRAESSAGKGEEAEMDDCFSVGSPVKDPVDQEALEEHGKGDEEGQNSTEANDHHKVEAEATEMNDNQLAVSIEPEYEDGSSALRNQQMVLKEGLDSEFDVSELDFPIESVFHGSPAAMEEEEVDGENVAAPTEPGETSRDQQSTMKKEEVDCQNEVNKMGRNDTACAFAYNESESFHSSSGKLSTRREYSADDSSLIHHQFGVNSSLASFQFADWDFSTEDEGVSIGGGGPGRTTGAAVENESVSGLSLRTSGGQSPANADSDSATCKAEDVVEPNSEIVKNESWDREEINERSSLSSTRENMKISSVTQRAPNRFFFKAFDMKENNTTPMTKMEHTTSTTAATTGTRRRALEDLPKDRSSAR